MVLGGYGNFGKRISRVLAAKGVCVLIVGRNGEKATQLAQSIGRNAEALEFDATVSLSDALAAHRPAVVINTVGPFQGQGYEVAKTCISNGVHYIDLADGRDFVGGISELNDIAKAAGVAVISGASTVPALTDAVLSEFKSDFHTMDHLKFGISPGQGAERGLATTKAILGYVGKRLRDFPGIHDNVFGWQDIYRQEYPALGNRWMANCEIPDLDLLPDRYGLRTIQFSAGMELGVVHIGIWCLSGLVRIGLPLNLPKFAAPLLRISNLFNRFGSSDGGMHIVIKGTKAGDPDDIVERCWFVVARDGDGPHIPTVPAIVLAKRIADGETPDPGAYPCLGLLNLDEYLEELTELNVQTFTTFRSIDP